MFFDSEETLTVSSNELIDTFYFYWIIWINLNWCNFENQLVTFKVFPNPFLAKTIVEIQESTELKSPVLSIYNLQGQLVEKIVEKNELKFIFSRKNLKAGVYVFELSDGKTTFAPQLIIVNGKWWMVNTTMGIINN